MTLTFNRQSNSLLKQLTGELENCLILSLNKTQVLQKKQIPQLEFSPILSQALL